ncbi:hypothetical protein [Streptomyces adelaidensis]|uniref:hypothetical protein n=1 Tax=Streptomyces adelaidensis TaxID=2796465 RepID=UPI001904BF88|nr:hypothetical protein [Streptomyces adelaidensis]
MDTAIRPWVSVMVPWSRHDLQCHSEESRRLGTHMEHTLPVLLERGRRSDGRAAVNGLPALKAFTDVLPAVVAWSARQFLTHAQPHPPPGPPHSVNRPRLLLDEAPHGDE